MPSTATERPRHWSRSGYVQPTTRPSTPSTGVKYAWLFPSPQGNPRRITATQNSTATGYFAVPWPDQLQFEKDALGYAEHTVGQKYLRRRLPIKHGNPAQSSLYCDSLEEISFHNFQKTWHECCTSSDALHAVGFPKTEMVAYRATFSQRSYLLFEDSEVSGDTVPELGRYITKFPETESFHRKIPGWGFAFADNENNPCTVLGSLPEYVRRWMYTQHQIPWDFDPNNQNAVPEDYIANTLGTVNNAVFDPDMRFYLYNGSQQNGFPAETLYYEDCKLSVPYHGADDKLYVDIHHIFLHNPRNWNKQADPTVAPNPSSFAHYKYIYQKQSDGTFYSPNRKPYLERNFNPLFWPAGAPL